MEEESNVKCALNECNRSWHVYLHTLNDLCGAGSQLANSLTVLETSSANLGNLQNHPTMLLKNSWNNLTRATREATLIVKANMESLLQEIVVLGNLEAARNHNALIIMENAQTLLKVQQEFCVASRRAFSALTCCLACQAPIGTPHMAQCSMLGQFGLMQQTNREIWHDRVWGGENSPFPSGVNVDPEPQLNLETSKRLQSLRGIFEQTNGLAPIRRQSMPATLINNCFSHLLKSPQESLICKKVQCASKPFYREVLASVDFPPFPLNEQETYVDKGYIGTQQQQQQLSEGKAKQNVTWNQTQMMSKMCNYENSNSDKFFIYNNGNEEGLLNALKLLSISPTKKRRKFKKIR